MLSAVENQGLRISAKFLSPEELKVTHICTVGIYLIESQLLK